MLIVLFADRSEYSLQTEFGNKELIHNLQYIDETEAKSGNQ